jgi:hypothetical protein
VPATRRLPRRTFALPTGINETRSRRRRRRRHHSRREARHTRSCESMWTHAIQTMSRDAVPRTARQTQLCIVTKHKHGSRGSRRELLYLLGKPLCRGLGTARPPHHASELSGGGVNASHKTCAPPATPAELEGIFSARACRRALHSPRRHANGDAPPPTGGPDILWPRPRQPPPPACHRLPEGHTLSLCMVLPLCTGSPSCACGRADGRAGGAAACPSAPAQQPLARHQD